VTVPEHKLSTTRSYLDPANWLHFEGVGPNAEMQKIRHAEIGCPAPFHDERFWKMHDEDLPDHLKRGGGNTPAERLGSVPISRIAGVLAGHAAIRSAAPKWGEVLFTGVHGAGLTAGSIAYLLDSDQVKYRGGGKFADTGYPQQWLSKIDPTLVSYGGLAFEQRGEYFFCTAGQQRVVFARFALWHHTHDLDTELTNVLITGGG
jgi:hypothetical protein